MNLTQQIFALSLLYILTTGPLSGQNQYFQQEIDYRIEVKLDDATHYLHAFERITYTNRAPDALNELYFHLWPNAYRDNSTAYAQQMLKLGYDQFYFADPALYGYIDSLDFRVDGEAIGWRLDQDHPDIARLTLAQPLLPGEQIIIETPFRVKIPLLFSRLGHLEQSYYISQWYPKPAVYDRDGWHPMPYLEMGEYYSEFARYEVHITLPANYIVAATGTLQTPSEQAFLKARAASNPRARRLVDSDTIPTSSSRWKTITFRAENVHDFAWFTDKQFLVEQKDIQLPSGATVSGYLFYTKMQPEAWSNGMDYLEEALRFFSDRVTPYPYDQISIVEGPAANWAGMEYPMIAIIPPDWGRETLFSTIAHEVGHNWFQGMLGFNERRHPWLDEGLTSYYEYRLSRQKFPRSRSRLLPDAMLGASHLTDPEMTYLSLARLRLDQAPDTPSEDFTGNLSYTVGAYEKPALGFRYLTQYLGEEKWDSLMPVFFRTWQFKHPQPEDLQSFLEKATDTQLNWFFRDLMKSNAVQDYRIKELVENNNNFRILVRNEGGVAGPFPVTTFRQGRVRDTRWVDGFQTEAWVQLPKNSFEEIVIDAEHLTLDINRKNNRIKTEGLLRKTQPLKVGVLPTVEQPAANMLYLAPFPAWNRYDGAMLGLVLYNNTFPPRSFEWEAAPMYAFGTGSLTGLGSLRYHFFPTALPFRKMTLGLRARTFHYRRNDEAGYDLRYRRLEPYLRAEWPAREHPELTHHLQWRSILLFREQPAFDQANGDYLGKNWTDRAIHELSYGLENLRTLHPYGARAALEYQRYPFFSQNPSYLKLSLEYRGAYTYTSERNLHFRIFVGGFLFNDRRRAGSIFPGAFNLVSQGPNDYRYDGLFLRRDRSIDLYSQQIALMDGGLKIPLDPAFAFGRSNNFIAALNLKLDLPGESPISQTLKPYFDVGYYDNAQPTGASDTFGDQLLWNGGLSLEIFDGLLRFYFPVIYSKNLREHVKMRGDYFTRISFFIDWDKGSPVKWLYGL